MAILQRGIAYRLQGLMPQALNDFNTVLLYQPHNIQNLSNLAQTYFAMRFFNEAMHFAGLGLNEANKQNWHHCDVEFSEVINRIKAMARLNTVEQNDSSVDTTK